jgi:hypothetical protein
MKNLLALLGALVVTFVAAGWYLGWYQVQTTTDANGHREVNIDLNTKKIQADINKGVDKVEKVIEHKNTTGTDTPTAPPLPHTNVSTVRPNAPEAPREILILPGGDK